MAFRLVTGLFVKPLGSGTYLRGHDKATGLVYAVFVGKHLRAGSPDYYLCEQLPEPPPP